MTLTIPRAARAALATLATVITLPLAASSLLAQTDARGFVRITPNR